MIKKNIVFDFLMSNSDETLRLLPRHFECSQEPDTSEDRQPQGRHHLVEGEDHFQQTAEDNEEIEPIEERDKVALKYMRSCTSFHLSGQEGVRFTWKPRAYIFNNISRVKRTTKNMFVISWNCSSQSGWL